MTTIILYILLSFLVSFVSSFFVATTSRGSLGERRGPQQFHKRPIPRFGGKGLWLALVAATFVAYIRREPFFSDLFAFVLVSTPVFLSGLIEDMKGNITPKNRLLIMVITSIFAFFIIEAKITRLDIPYVDYALRWIPISLIVSVFALTGLTNAINIIDGFNGLSSMVSITILSGIAYVSLKLNDSLLFFFSVLFAAALLGFFINNYPRAKIFLGDGGAYLTGFWIGLLSILLVARHEEVSPWFALVVNFYPVFETIFSMFRRKFLMGQSPLHADGLHLHTLFYKIVTKKIVKPDEFEKRNYLTLPFLWLLNLFAVIPAVIFWSKTLILVLSAVIFAVVYLTLYWSLLFHRMPKWARDRELERE